MPKTNNCIDKRRKFAGAIGLSGTSVVDFAKSLGVTVQAIYQTLANPKKSRRLSLAIDEFISEQLPGHTTAHRAAPRRRAA